MKWTLTVLGNTAGSAEWDNGSARLRAGESEDISFDTLKLCCYSGKLGDSEDSFLYCYVRIDPYTENFTLSASFYPQPGEQEVRQTAGYGILVADTAASPSFYSRHRNQLLAGVFGRDRTAGVRIISGYHDPDAVEAGPVRRYDAGRVFDDTAGERLLTEKQRFSVSKTDQGFTCEWNGEKISFKGSDHLLKQDDRWIYAGFALAGNLAVTVSDIYFKKYPGSLSHTPEGEIIHRLPPYPLDSVRFFNLRPDGHPAGEDDAPKVLFVSPEGCGSGEGKEESPMSIGSAVRQASPGTRIVLDDGVYHCGGPLYIPESLSGSKDRPVILEAKHYGRAVLDCSEMEERMPACILAADFWRVRGIVFRNAPSVGLLICGNNDRISWCEAHGNGDTGILVCSMDISENFRPPEGNIVSDCCSHHNADRYLSNADGFGAKLSVGQGNAFIRCVSHHNADDGFDLYEKSVLGPTAPVLLSGCSAYENGTPDNKAAGFKMGGENQPTAHRVEYCIAFRNTGHGFSSNSDPSGEYRYCAAFLNADGNRMAQMSFYSGRASSWTQKGLLSCGGKTGRILQRCISGRRSPDKKWERKRSRAGRSG